MKQDTNTTIQEIRELLRGFRDDRDWKQFHDPKSLASAIAIESAELMEMFLWKEKQAIVDTLESDPEYREEVGEELADVISYCLQFANAVDVDVTSLVLDKLEKNNKKYPVEKSKGNATKYTKL